MIKLDLLIFGYFKVTVPPRELAIAADVLLKSGFSAAIDPTGEFLIPYKKREDLSRAFDGIVKYEISSPKGIFGFFVNNRLRFGVFLGIIMSIFLVYLSSDIVWDVRIEGADDPEKIVEELSLSGLSVGSRWSRIDKSEVEADLLIFSDRVGWVNINRRGGVAYVRVGEKLLYPEDEKPLGYANIVAECDCVVEEIRAVSGYAVVKAGDSVKAGDILISGVIPSELGGGFCYASGVVIGRYEDSVSILAKREIIERIPDQRELYGVKINFFGKSLNIFKNHRQSDN